VGAFLFAFAPNAAALILARTLIGVGCAGGLMAAFKAIMRWFPPNRLALVNGCYMAIGGLGAMAATKPAELALQLTDWRGLFLGLAVLTLISATAIFLLAPRGDAAENPPDLKVQTREISKIFKDKLFWRVAPVSIFGMGGSQAIQTLWAGPWLTDSVALARDEVATRLLVMNAAMAIGFIATGWIADTMRTRGLSTLHVLAGGTLVSMVALLAIALRIDPAGWLHWAAFGFTCNVAAIVYAMLARHFGSAFAGRGNTANTLLVFAGTFLIQFAMGVIIDQWPRDAAGAYPTAAYQTAFGLVLAGLLLSLFWMYRPGADKDEALAKAL
ncbi:MAG: MFS transporter, partial [Rhodovibrionaceae bacterium]